MDLRWCIPGMPDDEIRTNILFTQDVSPGYSAVYEAITKEYFGFDFDGIFGEETFLYELEARKTFPCRMPLSDDRSGLSPGGQETHGAHEEAPGGDRRPGRGAHQEEHEGKGFHRRVPGKIPGGPGEAPEGGGERLMERQPPSGMGPGSTLSCRRSPGKIISPLRDAAPRRVATVGTGRNRS